MADAIIALPDDVLRWCRAVRKFQWIAEVDVRLLLAAGPPLVAQAETQVGIFDQTRVMLYAAGFAFSAASGIAYQIAQEKFTFWSCLAASLNSGLFGLGLMLFGLSWWPDQAGPLLGLCIGIGLCGPAATKSLQENLPDTLAWLLHTLAERAAGAKNPPVKPEENNP